VIVLDPFNKMLPEFMLTNTSARNFRYSRIQRTASNPITNFTFSLNMFEQPVGTKRINSINPSSSKTISMSTDFPLLIQAVKDRLDILLKRRIYDLNSLVDYKLTDLASYSPRLEFDR